MKRPLSISISLLIIGVILGCETKDNAFRDQYRWLSGKWEGRNGDAIMIEDWMWNKYRFEGKGYEILNGDTLTNESLFLEDFDGVVGYSVIVNGSGPYTFGLKDTAQRDYVFVNEDHDFPAIIQYHRDKDSTITLSLMKLSTPDNAEVSYQLKRRAR